jgi:pimeloyl-ACP methyl ester carboxylesterase
MATVIFIPGIMGCAAVPTAKIGGSKPLSIWPPRGAGPDTIVAFLKSDKIKFTEPLRDFLGDCIQPIYGALLDGLDAAGIAVQSFVYDWRIDIRTLADRLAAVVAAAADDVILLAHSMGGLIARTMLEDGRHPAAVARTRHLICMATPHLGAPLALFRILGLDGLNECVLRSGDFRALSLLPVDYPAGYQLLPAPGREFVFAENRPVDIYAETFFSDAELPWSGLAAAQAMHGTLARFARPAGVDYHLFAGTGIDGTVQSGRFEPQPGADGMHRCLSRVVSSEGDGTVPLWSAVPARWADLLVKALPVNHIAVTAQPEVVAFLSQLLGQAAPSLLAMAAPRPRKPKGKKGKKSAPPAATPAAPLPAPIRIGVPMPGVAAGSEIAITVSFPDGVAAAGDLTIRARGKTASRLVNSVTIAAGSGLTGLKLRLAAPKTPGIYDVAFVPTADGPAAPAQAAQLVVAKRGPAG